MGQPKRKDSSEAAEEPLAEVPATEPEAEAWAVPTPPSRRGIAVLVALVVLFNVPILHYFFFRGAPEAPLALPFQDDYSDTSTVQKNYSATGGLWRVESGELLSPGVRNNPLWLKAKLPQNVAVEFDVRSMSPEGDIKVELFGDGMDHASGYVFIHGGWNNSLSIIARLDEHGMSQGALQVESQRVAIEKKLSTTNPVETGVFKKDTRMRVEANPFRVELGRRYHWRIERRGSLITWFIDGAEFMRFDDPYPLAGPGHDRLGFSSWEAQLFFDNLRVTAL